MKEKIVKKSVLKKIATSLKKSSSPLKKETSNTKRPSSSKDIAKNKSETTRPTTKRKKSTIRQTKQQCLHKNQKDKNSIQNPSPTSSINASSLRKTRKAKQKQSKNTRHSSSTIKTSLHFSPPHHTGNVATKNAPIKANDNSIADHKETPYSHNKEFASQQKTASASEQHNSLLDNEERNRTPCTKEPFIDQENIVHHSQCNNDDTKNHQEKICPHNQESIPQRETTSAITQHNNLHVQEHEEGNSSSYIEEPSSHANVPDKPEHLINQKNIAHHLQLSENKNYPLQIELETEQQHYVSLKEIKEWAPGHTFPAFPLNTNIVNISFNKKIIARGEILEIGNIIGVKIIEILFT